MALEYIVAYNGDYFSLAVPVQTLIMSLFSVHSHFKTSRPSISVFFFVCVCWSHMSYAVQHSLLYFCRDAMWIHILKFSDN